MMATFAASPIAFNAWAALLGSLSDAFDVKTRDSIGLAISEVNGCNYCLTVHSYTAERMAKLPADGCLAMVRRVGRKLADAEREGLVEELRKWIRREQR